MKQRIVVIVLSLLLGGPAAVKGQEPLTREQILSMTTDELTELPLDELMAAVETLGVTSVDELFAMIMNKGVSSASKDDESVFTSPMATTVITGEEMRTYGCTSIEEALRLVPGVIVQEKYNGVYDIHLRGLNSIPDNNMILYTENSNILVMVDGRICHNYAMGTTSFEFLPISLEDIDRIEVVRGAASALYGANAVQGVINIITIKPDTEGAKARGYAQAGNNVVTAELGLRRMFGSKFAMGLTASYNQRRRPTEDIRMIPQANMYVVNDDDVFDVKNGHKLDDDELAAAIASGQITDVSGDDVISYTDMEHLHTRSMNASIVETPTLEVFQTSNEQTDHERQFEDTYYSRRNCSFNAYFSIVPNPNGRIDVSGGYQQANYYTTSPGNDDMAMRQRESKTGYVNILGRMRGLTLNAGFSDGMQDFSTGTDGFRMQRTTNLQAQADYDIRIEKAGLSIRPSFGYQYQKYKDAKPRWIVLEGDTEATEMQGYFGKYSLGENYAEMWALSPGVRVEYRVGPWRLIAAYRADKTHVPDTWNHSGQGIVSCQINDQNFLRLGYGRAFRSAAVVNTQSNFRWSRNEMCPPGIFQFMGNKNAPLVHIDNFEIGYRCQPNPKILIDAEAFFSRSTDYGALKSYNTVFLASGKDLRGVLGDVIGLDMWEIAEDPALRETFLPLIVSQAAPMLNTKCYLRYDALPYKVQQMGISANVDWILSPKVILKLNANIQRTKIDNYYQYSQPEAIMGQLAAAGAALDDKNTGLLPLIDDIVRGAVTAKNDTGDPYTYINHMMIKADVDQYFPGLVTATDAASLDAKAAACEGLMEAFLSGTGYQNCPNDKTLGAYYGLKYGVRYDRANDEYEIGGAYHNEPEMEDNHKHKATPSFYGMAGVVFKPIEKLAGSASVVWMTRREYTTNFGTKKLAPRCTVNLKVGYKPIPEVELFVNLRNLLNTEKQEFIYTDPIGGSYMAGLSLAF